MMLILFRLVVVFALLRACLSVFLDCLLLARQSRGADEVTVDKAYHVHWFRRNRTQGMVLKLRHALDRLLMGL